MHDLIPLGPALPGALTTAEIDATMAYAEAEKALATRQAYASVPAHVGIVASYLSGLADSSRKASTIGRRAAAIGYHHKMAGHEPPTNHEGVKATLRGIRRTIGTARAGKAPATADLIGQMLALCPDNMIGKRDRALLCLGFAGAFRRSELCALEVDDLTEVPDGLRILIRRSKGDQEGQGQEVAIPRGYRLRPVEAVQAWLAAAEITSGPVFRAVALGGKVSDAPLADNSAARIVQRYARRVELDPASYAGHSLRSGFLTSAAESGASIWKLSEDRRLPDGSSSGCYGHCAHKPGILNTLHPRQDGCPADRRSALATVELPCHRGNPG